MDLKFVSELSGLRITGANELNANAGQETTTTQMGLRRSFRWLQTAPPVNRRHAHAEQWGLIYGASNGDEALMHDSTPHHCARRDRLRTGRVLVLIGCVTAECVLVGAQDIFGAWIIHAANASAITSANATAFRPQHDHEVHTVIRLYESEANEV